MNNINKIEDFTIVFENTVGCSGHCAGCILSETQRIDKNPKFTEELLELSLNKVHLHLKELKSVKRVQLVFGIADNFLLPMENLEKIFLKSSKVIKQLNVDKESGIFITTSLIDKTENIVRKLKYLQNLSDRENVRLFFNVILDSHTFKRPKFLEVFSKNIQKSVEISKSLDLTINLSSETVSHVTPEELINYCKKLNFKHLVINWLPTKNNFNKVYKNNDKVIKWLEDLIIESKNKNFDLTFNKTIENIFTFVKNYENFSLIEILKSQFIYNSVNNLIIDSNGEIFINYEAIGDIPHGHNLGINPLGTVYEKKSIIDMLNENSMYYTKIGLKNVSNEQCLHCDFIKECTISGFHYYNKIIFDNINDEVKTEMNKTLETYDCFHLAKPIFKLLKNL